tara:strand:- start:327 stop:833 length:507 start_codon:yes stop_codon:yes gene_type:complete
MSVILDFNNDWTLVNPQDSLLLKRFVGDTDDRCIEFSDYISSLRPSQLFPVTTPISPGVMDTTDDITATVGRLRIHPYDNDGRFSLYETDSDDDMPELIDASVDSNGDMSMQSTDKRCPVCRTVNTLDQCIEIKGLSEECKVCLCAEVEMLFTGCKHACVCKKCLERL